MGIELRSGSGEGTEIEWMAASAVVHRRSPSRAGNGESCILGSAIDLLECPSADPDKDLPSPDEGS